MPVALFDFQPGFCPLCGRETPFSDMITNLDYRKHCPRPCKCGFEYQCISTPDLLRAAGKEGEEHMRKLAQITITEPLVVDADIADEIRWLNEQGVRTKGSCSGHGEIQPTAMIKPSSVQTARELGYTPHFMEEQGLFEIKLLGKDGTFEIELDGGRTAQCQPVSKQPYADAIISAGMVEGISPDTVYLRLEKTGQEPTTLFLRPDEMQAVAYCCNGTLWSIEIGNIIQD